jgi:hypothetical protein
MECSVLAPLLLTTVVCCIWSDAGFDMLVAEYTKITVCLTAEDNAGSHTAAKQELCCQL